MINEIDADRKGAINFNEFLNMVQKQREYIDGEDEVLEAFRFVHQSIRIIMSVYPKAKAEG